MSPAATNGVAGGSTRPSKDELKKLRSEVRQWARDAAMSGRFAPAVDGQARFDRSVSQELAERGWIGGNLPAEFGGHPRSAPEQWVLTEELIAASVPLAAHYVGERQTARLLLRFASEALKKSLLPRVARGEIAFGIAMSEPGSGSDLASIRTRAVHQDGAWVINGQKIWSSSAYTMDYLVVLCRTGAEAEKHEGLSQVLVPTSAPGLEIRRIASMDGEDEFCEVFFTDVTVPEDHLIGEAGQGWKQITTELSFERAWPERYLTNVALLESFRTVVADSPDERARAALGAVVTRLMSLRSLSWQAVEGAEAGRDVSGTAALAKDAGTTFDRGVSDVIRDADLAGRRFEPGPFRTHFRRATALAPSITIRGGTNEILRGIIARTLSVPLFTDNLSPAEAAIEQLLKRELNLSAITDWVADPFHPDLWAKLEDLGFLDEVAAAGAGDLALSEALGVIRLSSYHVVPVPLAEDAFLGRWLLAQANAPRPAGKILTIAGANNLTALQIDSEGVLRGSGALVPTASPSDEIVAIAWNEGRPQVVLLPVAELVAGSEEGPFFGSDVAIDGWRVPDDRRFAISRQIADDFLLRGALARSAQLVGAMARSVDLAIAYSNDRHQFGRRIASFQAVRDLVVGAARELSLAKAAFEVAARAAEAGINAEGVESAIAVAKATSSRASIEVARSIHQVHAAIGVTREYPLHRLSLCCAVWRDEFGTEQDWESRVGAAVTSADVPHVWDFITQVEVAG